MPAIMRFLGYNPLPPPDGWAERLVRCRTVLGLSQKESALRIGVDQCTLARWERGEREPTGAFEARALTFVAGWKRHPSGHFPCQHSLAKDFSNRRVMRTEVIVASSPMKAASAVFPGRHADLSFPI
jgi:predicted transcriptional regulator